MYNYEQEKKWVFTEEGQVQFLKIRDRINKLLNEAGAFNMQCAVKECGGDSWSMLACVDRLVELKEIKEINRGDQVPGQHRIFTKIGK